MASSSTLSHDSGDCEDEEFSVKIQAPRVLTKSRGMVSSMRANWESNTADVRNPCNAEDDDQVFGARSNDKRPARPIHYGKGKSAKEKRKMREKRRSTGVVNLNQESTGEELDDEDEETANNTVDNKASRLPADAIEVDESRVKSGYTHRITEREDDTPRYKPLCKISPLATAFAREPSNSSADSKTESFGIRSTSSRAIPVGEQTKPLPGQRTTSSVFSRFENASNQSSNPIDWRTRLRSSSTSGKEPPEGNHASELDKLKKDLATEKAERSSLERQMQEQNQRLADSQLTVAELSDEIKTLNQELDDMDEDNLKLLETNRALMERLGLSTS